MTRAQDRTAARREARVRRAELRLFAAARAFSGAVERAAEAEEGEDNDVIAARCALEAAAHRYSEIAPPPRRRRRRRGR